jgi:hypothetical protein
MLPPQNSDGASTMSIAVVTGRPLSMRSRNRCLQGQVVRRTDPQRCHYMPRWRWILLMSIISRAIIDKSQRMSWTGRRTFNIGPVKVSITARADSYAAPNVRPS